MLFVLAQNHSVRTLRQENHTTHLEDQRTCENIVPARSFLKAACQTSPQKLVSVSVRVSATVRVRVKVKSESESE